MASRRKKQKFKWVEDIILWPEPGSSPAVVLEVLLRFTNVTADELIILSGLPPHSVGQALKRLDDEAFIQWHWARGRKIRTRFKRYAIGPAARWWLRRARWMKETKRRKFRAVNYASDQHAGSAVERAIGEAN